MQSANGGHDGRYLPSSMDYTGMTHHPHHPHHHLSASTDPHSGLHYALPPTSMPPSGHQPPHHHLATKRVTDLDMMGGNASSDEDGSMDIKPSLSERSGTGRGTPLKSGSEGPPTGKKTKGRVKIKMEFIDNKLRRYTTFSKRKTGIMKKAYELSTLTGTQVMLLVASETGHVYTFATRKLQPMITSDAGKALIQTCLNSPDPPPTVPTSDQRMSVSGYEETELTYNVADTEQQEKVVPTVAPEHAGGDSDDEDDGEEEEEIEMEDSEIHHQTQARQVQQRQSEVRFSPSAHHRTSSSSPMKQNEGSGQGKRKSSLPYLMTKEKVTRYSSTKMPPLVKAGYQMSSSEVLSNRPGPSSYLPAEVISQLLASGHHMREGHSSHQQMPRSQSSSGGQDIILPSSITITASRMPSTSRGPPKQP